MRMASIVLASLCFTDSANSDLFFLGSANPATVSSGCFSEDRDTADMGPVRYGEGASRAAAHTGHDAGAVRRPSMFLDSLDSSSRWDTVYTVQLAVSIAE